MELLFNLFIASIIRLSIAALFKDVLKFLITILTMNLIQYKARLDWIKSLESNLLYIRFPFLLDIDYFTSYRWELSKISTENNR